ncbi:hypothetical protein DFP72DRAFT_927596 [Ephemerocybe angulata]|uniref:Uncharacterized protein n=1 Tax=Ephemerocybe angulata TaxID=980116 RepID=A0A8H6HFA7_9AGAR|nr:hypothetical protein DFP72DRAFT_927596 [Tulosesus angulatus]
MGTEKEPSPGSDSRLITSFRGRRSKLVGYIRSTLDASQTETVLMGISILDLPGTWKRLLEQYEPKDSSSRITILQELISLRMRSSGFENESYQDFGSRAVALGARLTSLLPVGVTLKDAESAPLSYKEGDRTVKVNVLKKEAELVEGYTAAYLARDISLAMIIIGLGKEDKLLRHTLNHISATSVDADPSVILDHLCKADSLTRNTSLADGTSSTALQAASKPKKTYKCKYHRSNSHTNEECRFQNGKAQVAEVASQSPATPQEKALMAQVAHITQELPHI